MTGNRSKLAPRDAAIEVIARLRRLGHTAYLAGGCVRDELLGVEPKDYDVATDARPEQIGAEFLRTGEVGASFGVMLVREFGPAIEVATFRSDGPYSDSRRPDHVEFADAEGDAHRRDFTINALFLDPFEDDPDARVIDHVGGRADIAGKILRAVGDPNARLAEDHLRALRAVRFAARYALTIDPDTARAIREHAAALSGVSVERVGDEIRRMMAGPNRAEAARLVQDLGLDAPIFGEALGDAPLPTLSALDAGATHSTALGAWAFDRLGDAVLSEQDARAAGWRAALDMSTDEARAFAGALAFAGRVIREWPGLGVAQRKRLASCPLAPQGALLLAPIDPGAHAAYADGVRDLERDGVGLAPDPLLDGDLLVELGFVPGPGFGDVLKDVYDAQLEGRVTTRNDAITLAEALAPGHGVDRRDPA